jgi:hypothetical protein
MKHKIGLKMDYDSDQAVRDWLATRPLARITKVHPVERLPLVAASIRPGRKIEAVDQYSVLIEFEEP